MKRAQIAILLITLAFALSYATAMATEQAAPVVPAIQSSTTSTPTDTGSDVYAIQTEDVLRITVLGEPELTTEQVVDPKGYINVSLIGQILAKDLTRKELTSQIVQGLSKYLVEPKVQISLSQFRRPKVHVLGLVNRPGIADFRPGDRVMEAIAQAGSYREDAYLEGATLTRSGSKEPVSLDLHKLFFENDMAQNVALQDGDTIFIPEDNTNRYFVLGEVNRPSKYPLKDKVTVVDAISAAGGITPRADAKTTYIIRGDPKNPQKIKVDVSRFLKSADVSQNILLLPGDVIYVPETSKPDWSKIAGIISVVVNTSYLARMWGF